MKDGEVILLENVRFYKEEEQNDPAFAKVTCLSHLHSYIYTYVYGALRVQLHAMQGARLLNICAELTCSTI
jgi:3-phosphoglycerate kinase